MKQFVLICALLLAAGTAKGEDIDLQKFWEELRDGARVLCAQHQQGPCRYDANEVLGLAGEIFSIHAQSKVRKEIYRTKEIELTAADKKRIGEIQEKYREYLAKWRPDK